MTHPHRPTTLARAAFLLACLAVAVRVWVPQGFMAAPLEGQGLSPIVLCSGQGPITRFIDKTGRLVDGSPQPHDHSNKGAHGPPCVFSGAATGLTPGPSVVLTTDAANLDASVALSPPGLRPGLGLCAPPPPQTGPPLTT